MVKTEKPVTDDDLAVDIVKYLAAEGKLFSKENMLHNYPHCWRCQTPLIYYSKPSWYIEMSKLKDRQVKSLVKFLYRYILGRRVKIKRPAQIT